MVCCVGNSTVTTAGTMTAPQQAVTFTCGSPGDHSISDSNASTEGGLEPHKHISVRPATVLRLLHGGIRTLKNEDWIQAILKMFRGSNALSGRLNEGKNDIKTISLFISHN